MTNPIDHAAQLGFDALLARAEEQNRKRQVEQETAHLPATMADALPFYRELIARHHEAMLAADVDKVLSLRREADRLALRLNGGEPGILAHEDSPGNVLTRETAAAPGELPLWGQAGEFVITAGTMKVRIELEGMFGIGGGFSFWPGFSAHAVEFDQPFLSGTGYRSFLGIRAEAEPRLAPDAFAAKVIAAHAGSLKGRLVAIEQRHR